LARNAATPRELAGYTLRELAKYVERLGLEAVYLELERRRAAGRPIDEPML